MKRIKLKNRKRSYKLLLITFIFFVILIISIGIIIKFEDKINKKMIVFCEAEINKISKLIVIEAVNDALSETISTDGLLIVEKNSNGNIQSVELNTKKANEFIVIVNKKIVGYFEDLEDGKSDFIRLNKNLITNSKLLTTKDGLVFEIPIGIVTNSTFLSNLGPKIPVKFVISGDLESEIKTNVETYGINSALLTVIINIKVSEQILLPTSSKIITIDNSIPIITRMIQGEIPSYYFDKTFK